MAVFSFPRPVRRIIARFARVVCPPAIDGQVIVEAVVDELQLMVGAMPRHVRLALIAGFTAFDQGSRVYPPSRGRRFVDLGDEQAHAYFLANAHGPLAPQRKILQLMKGLVTMSYYEQPMVLAAMEYHPDAYIAQVAKRRFASYAEDIRRGEAAVTTDAVLVTLGHARQKEGA